MSYLRDFSRVYDKFTSEVRYEERAAYIKKLLADRGVGEGILLDLACGTGVLTEMFADAGYSVIGADISEDMLMIARQRLGDRALFLCQDMRELDLYGTVDCCVCSLDSLNHLTEESDLAAALEKVALFTRPGGVFVFDMNTVFKHESVLGNNTFVYEDETDFLVWQNFYDEETLTTDILIDIFSLDGSGKYERGSEEFSERAYPVHTVEKLLKKAGFRNIAVFGDMSSEAPADDEERIYFCCVKE